MKVLKDSAHRRLMTYSTSLVKYEGALNQRRGKNGRDMLKGTRLGVRGSKEGRNEIRTRQS